MPPAKISRPGIQQAHGESRWNRPGSSAPSKPTPTAKRNSGTNANSPSRVGVGSNFNGLNKGIHSADTYHFSSSRNRSNDVPRNETIVRAHDHRYKTAQRGGNTNCGRNSKSGTPPTPMHTPSEIAIIANRWSNVPTEIQTQEAQQRERNRASRLARKAEETASGVKHPSPPQPSVVENFRRVGVMSAEGMVASRAKLERRDLKQVATNAIVNNCMGNKVVLDVAGIDKDSLGELPPHIRFPFMTLLKLTGEKWM